MIKLFGIQLLREGKGGLQGYMCREPKRVSRVPGGVCEVGVCTHAGQGPCHLCHGNEGV